jgi:4-carboxymuconolactone decarboxylase
MSDDRYQRGLAKLTEIHGERGKAILDNLATISPDLKRFIIEFAFGDIYSRDGLDPKTRQLITIAALTTLNTSELELKAHIHGALNVGCTREQITETILQIAVYAGFPAALHGMLVAGQAFSERGC